MITTVSIMGCGWLGLPLGRFLSTKRYLVRGSTTTCTKMDELKHAGIEPFLIKLADPLPPDISKFLSSDVVIVTLPPRTKDYEDSLKILIREMEKFGTGRCIFISSTSVYPSNNSLILEQDAAYIISSHSKVNLLKEEDKFRNNINFKTTIIRFGGLYGPERHPGKFLSGKTGLGGANNPVNLIHLDDCLHIIYGLIRKNIWGDTFNATSPIHPKRREFYMKASLSLGEVPPQFADNSDQSFKIISSEKLISRLNYTFIHSNPIDDF